jgi:AcrR family transcriptional regulator
MSGRGGAAGGIARQRLTRDRVVTAALAIVDRDGLDQLTMRALGRELAVDPMAVYHWFPNKLAILQGVVEAILTGIPAPDPAAPIRWPDGVRLMARSYRDAIIAHPNALPVVSTQPVLSRPGLLLIEATAALLVRGGLAPVEALEAINGAAALVIGSVLVEVGVTPGSEPVEQAQIEATYAELPPDQFPTILAVMAEATPDSFDSTRQFEDLLDAYVRGLEARFADA